MLGYHLPCVRKNGTNPVNNPSSITFEQPFIGALAQLGERLPCTQEVCGSIPHSSTIFESSAVRASCRTTRIAPPIRKQHPSLKANQIEFHTAKHSVYLGINS